MSRRARLGRVRFAALRCGVSASDASAAKRRAVWRRMMPVALLGVVNGCGRAASDADSPAAHQAPAASSVARAEPQELAGGAAAGASPDIPDSAASRPAATAPATAAQASGDEPATDVERAVPAVAADEADAAMAPRQVLYRVGGADGLVIEVDGVRMTPSAEVLEKSNGGYGVRLQLALEVVGDAPRTLLVPKHGPLSMAATVFDRNGKAVAEHADVREGGEYVSLAPGSQRVFTRDWPSGSVKGPLWWGRRLHLEVGLWGLGQSEQEQLPVRKLFQLDLTANASPRALITPPKVK